MKKLSFQKTWCNILDILFTIDVKRKKILLWLAGFRSISKMEIVCSDKYCNETYTIDKDGNFHKSVELILHVK